MVASDFILFKREQSWQRTAAAKKWHLKWDGHASLYWPDQCRRTSGKTLRQLAERTTNLIRPFQRVTGRPQQRDIYFAGGKYLQDATIPNEPRRSCSGSLDGPEEVAALEPFLAGLVVAVPRSRVRGTKSDAFGELEFLFFDGGR